MLKYIHSVKEVITVFMVKSGSRIFEFLDNPVMIKIQLLVFWLDLLPLLHTKYPVGVVPILANTMELYGVPPGDVQELPAEPYEGLGPYVVQSHWLEKLSNLCWRSFR